ncbi:hypothetical protein CEB3_c29320 [Peptococcaceae bacterium CEB3]|nr:hypothetical protein CEB3_c29320 [Peptococcaceae bacterium CEB3]
MGTKPDTQRKALDRGMDDRSFAAGAVFVFGWSCQASVKFGLADSFPMLRGWCGHPKKWCEHCKKELEMRMPKS